MRRAFNDSATTLLMELARRGIELRADGGRLRFRPKHSMTTELADRVREHKATLLALLAGDVQPKLATISAMSRSDCHHREREADNRAVFEHQRRMETQAAKPTEPEAKWFANDPEPKATDANFGGLPATIPTTVLELAIAREGWSPRSWRDRLIQMAECCEALHPKRASELRLAAIYMTPAWRELYDERAAIAEFDGGLSREQAEASALRVVLSTIQDAKAERGGAP